MMGSFSKTVTPGFRMGYILTKDHALLKAINTAKEAADLHTNVFAQYVILDYLEHNDLDEHLVKIRNLYRDQARAMTDAMAECFPAEVSFTKPEGGMFLWATLPEGINTMDLFPKALERNVAFVPGEPFYAEPGARSTMRLNFTNADEESSATASAASPRPSLRRCGYWLGPSRRNPRRWRPRRTAGLRRPTRARSRAFGTRAQTA
ncbi:MAG: aminotransferase class I/II-fold pyridoxal phosphate-dependent enzyme [Adlercreutzia equolifaciens]